MYFTENKKTEVKEVECVCGLIHHHILMRTAAYHVLCLHLLVESILQDPAILHFAFIIKNGVSTHFVCLGYSQTSSLRTDKTIMLLFPLLLREGSHYLTARHVFSQTWVILRHFLFSVFFLPVIIYNTRLGWNLDESCSMRTVGKTI